MTQLDVYIAGEICGLEQTVIPQTQFSPLPEVLCLMVSELEDRKCSTTFDALLDALKLRYKGMHQPGEQIVYESLGALVQEGKLYHTGMFSTEPISYLFVSNCVLFKK